MNSTNWISELPLSQDGSHYIVNSPSIGEDGFPNANETYWPPDLTTDRAFTVVAVDDTSRGSTSFTIRWTDGTEGGPFEAPSAFELIETRKSFRKVLEPQLERFEWPEGQTVGSGYPKDRSVRQLRALYEDLWLRYRDATIGKVAMWVPVSFQNSDGDKEYRFLRVALPSGFVREPDDIDKGLRVWVAQKGYELAADEPWHLAYWRAVMKRMAKYVEKEKERIQAGRTSDV